MNYKQQSNSDEKSYLLHLSLVKYDTTTTMKFLSITSQFFFTKDFINCVL